MDIFVALAGLVLMLPLMLVIAAAIRITSGRQILFRQWRLGRNGQRFRLLKFRTMIMMAPSSGPGVTRSGDARITPIGGWLRKWKIDELPQLFNVLRGEMTLVGPRPDLEEFWAQATAADRAVLAFTPGLTGAASIAFCDEERVLAQVPPGQLSAFYVEHVLPKKALLDIEYARRASFRSDCGMLIRTLLVPFTSGDDVKRELHE